ncbi:hypothetical protein SUGI_0355380 [Cryptomeria japonica]|nr:hypothetical protein SUGI_0355380 [Cryptomeria japonica]
MATFFGLLSSRGFLWVQLGIFIWQAIRPTATMRLPWALLSTGIYKIFSKKKFRNDYFVLLSTDYNDTADANQFLAESKANITEYPLGDSSVIVFHYNKSHYICDSEKARQVRLLIAAELNGVPIVKEYKVVNGFMGVWNLCSADEAIRMCLPSKRFRLSFRKIFRFCLTEHMPLIVDTYWLSKILSGIPLYLNANGDEELSSILTLVLIILDFTYNIWVPILEKAYLITLRSVQLLLSTLGPNLRVMLFYFLSNFDNKYLPCSIGDFKVNIKKTGSFYTTDNTVLNCPVKWISKVRFDEVDISSDHFELQASAFRVHLSILQRRNDFVEFELRLLDLLFNLVKVRYTMSVHNFQTYIGCWKFLKEGDIGLVQTVDKGIINNMHLFGLEDAINMFWGTDINVYKVDIGEAYHFMIAGENEKKFITWPGFKL